MRYVSTRGESPSAAFAEVLLRGLAPDGGLYAPERWPRLSPAASATPYASRLQETLDAFAGPLASGVAQQAVAGFRHPDIAPLKRLSADLYLLELFHGPTLAFKDLAMQAMAPLLERALVARGETLLLLTATSGDTGAAAVHAFAGSSRIRLCVLHPAGRVSPVQRRQMTTCTADNVLNLAIQGDFDDCQRLVKALLRGRSGRSSVNSINWGRLAGQIPYYFDRSAQVAGGPSRCVIPTGNFGDAFSGWAARACGAPVGSILAAVNRNDTLALALREGVLLRQPAQATPSVSMDVSLPSNLERLVFEAADRQPEAVRNVFAMLDAEGRVTLPPALLSRLRQEVTAVSCDDEAMAAAMRRARAEYGEIVCPHTAVGLAAHWAAPHAGPSIVLATAHPAKFPEAVSSALGEAPAMPDPLRALFDLPERCETLPPEEREVEAALLRRFG